MWTAVVLALSVNVFSAGQARQAAALPDTPQGRAVQAFIAAFNSNDEKTFLEMQQRLFTAAYVKRRTPEERAKAYRDIRNELGRLEVTSVGKATALVIEVTFARGSTTADMVFEFEEAAPYRISSVALKVLSED
jgi:hypothetical protein